MDGNVDADGITADLEWLQTVGVRGVQMFEGGMGTPLVIPAAVEADTPEWQRLVAHAVSEADRLGLELTIASSPGWSSAGGPWVAVADAMQKLVWSETSMSGGSGHVLLPPLPDVAGPYQEIPSADANEVPRYAHDLLVVAFPDDADQRPLVPRRVTGSAEIHDPAVLWDGRFDDAVEMPRDPNAPSTAWIQQSFDEPVTVSSVTIATPAPHGFGAAPAPECTLECSEDGLTYSQVMHLSPTPIDVRTSTFTPITAQHFRLTLRGDTALSVLPKLAPELAVPNVLRSKASFVLTEFSLWQHPRIHQGELKAGFAAASDYFPLDTPPSEARLRPEDVLDVTEHLGPDGVLRWDAPDGQWRILRLGCSPTGHMNGPAPAAMTGLEVDKMDAAKVKRYLAHHLGRFKDFLHADGSGPRIAGFLNDSIESGPQNATTRLRERFSELRGYDIARWAPCLTGRIVGDASSSDKFLYDFRQTLSDLLSSDYYATVREVAHSFGLTYYAEALEDGRPQLGNDLEMRSHADVPMGAAWVFDAGTDTSRPTYIADLRGASSVAHVYGKDFTGAESMTAFHRAWSYTPRNLKHVADLELSLGVTRFCIHTSPHQPSTTPPPGIALAPFLGQAFTRFETWAAFAGEWIDYLARCSWLLNQGEPAVDVAVFIGEEGPVTGLFEHTVDTTIPSTVGFDYIDLTALTDVAHVENGNLVTRGASYRALVLGGASARMTVRALKRIEQLAAAGATVIGSPPVSSPSLSDDVDEFDRLVRRLWGDGLVCDENVSAALADRGIRSSIRVTSSDIHSIGRRVDDGELWFLANPLPTGRTVTVETDGPLIAWDPVSLQRQAVIGTPGTTSISLPASGSVFLLMGATGEHNPTRATTPRTTMLSGTWTLDVPGHALLVLDKLESWSSLGMTGYSGRALYRTSFNLDEPTAGCSRYSIALQGVHDIAEVRVNGVTCGRAWTEPDRVDITGAVRRGANILEIDVANSWMNRLIAESRKPSGELFSPPTTVYKPDADHPARGLGRTRRTRTA